MVDHVRVDEDLSELEKIIPFNQRDNGKAVKLKALHMPVKFY